jgi:drug/metabolite transporter (DMT)-like permease
MVTPLHLETAIVGHGVGAPKLQMTTPLHHSRRLHLKTILFILLSVILAPLGNVLLGKGMKRVGSFKSVTAHNFLPFIERTFSSPWLWLGIACLVSFFVVQMLLLTWADYSYVQPASALSYAFVAILSYLLLGEVASPLRWTGIAVICAGVLIVGRTSPQSTGPA